MPKIAALRTIGLVLMIVGMGSGIYFALEARRIYTGYFQWMDARPFEMTVDLSKPGKAVAPFVQTCQSAHSEDVFFNCPELSEQQLEHVEFLFVGLQAEMRIENKSGEVVESIAVNSRSIHYAYGKVVLASFYPFERGDYQVVLDVNSGAQALAGKSQTIYAKYMLCGLEIMPAYLAGIIAIVAMIVGVVSAVGCVPGLLRYGVKSAPTNAPQ